ncbi:Arginine transport ATP-binding protein ArtM [Macrococcoides caseolyticum]|uniref:ABC transporter ATP-binding protein n=1 Tax=Macrococcoides caseolyticum TaxID=69966 RepID=UPI000DFE3E09|nr:ABC transporter ATP-binding protein [Macrococcus caseolyticus]STY74813.1 Arginine transport ATP-binding protein ArtM [Macrococcus caseolyticus]
MIRIKNLSYHVKSNEILKNISFEINRGDVIALVGPNGAGKSTLIDCLVGNKILFNGEIIGREILNDKDQSSILYQKTYFSDYTKVRHIIKLYQSLYDSHLSLNDIFEITQFEESILHIEANKLSGGQKRILDVALVLMGNPDFIIFDEPTAGMDTNTRKRFYQIIKKLKNEGKTIFFTSHYIEEVETLADRVILLHQGAIIRDSTPHDIRLETSFKQVEIPVQDFDFISSHNLNIHQKNKDYVTFNTCEIDVIVKQLLENKVSFKNIQITNESLLERVFKVMEDDHSEEI